jgi:hypothetical protein
MFINSLRIFPWVIQTKKVVYYFHSDFIDEVLKQKTKKPKKPQEVRQLVEGQISKSFTPTSVWFTIQLLINVFNIRHDLPTDNRRDVKKNQS